MKTPTHNMLNNPSMEHAIFAFRLLVVFFLSLLFVGTFLSGPGLGATSSAANTPSNVTVNVYVSMALSTNLSNGVLFGSLDPNTINNNASGNYNETFNTSAWVYVGLDSNVNLDFCIRDNESLRTGAGATPTATIANGNFTYTNSSTSNTNALPAWAATVGAPTNMTTTNNRFGVNIAPGAPVFLRFYLNVSGGQTPGIYSNLVRFVGVQAGTDGRCSGA